MSSPNSPETAIRIVESCATCQKLRDAITHALDAEREACAQATLECCLCNQTGACAVCRAAAAIRERR